MTNNIITLSNNNQQICTQRKEDGYINATLLCQSANKLFGGYQRLETTNGFLGALSADMQIHISELIEIKKGGNPQE